MNTYRKLFFILFLLFLFTGKSGLAADNEKGCEIVFYAKTLEGIHDVSVCSTGHTTTFKYGKIGTNEAVTFSSLSKAVRFHVDYNVFAEEEALELYFPYQNNWYGIYLLQNPDRISEAMLTLSRRNKNVSGDFYDTLTHLQGITLDTESVIDKLEYTTFTPL